MAEFGGSLVDENAEAEGSREEVETGMSAGTTEEGIELDEYQSQPQDAELTDVIGESLLHLIGTTCSDGIFKGSDRLVCQGTCILFASRSLEYRVNIHCATISCT